MLDVVNSNRKESRAKGDKMKADTTEKNQAQDFVDRAIRSLENCGEALGRISASCCIPQRSNQMAGAFDNLQKSLSELQHGPKSRDTLPGCLENIVECGSRIGKLYVTCCTETREPLYQQILKELNEAHGNVGRILGQSH